MLNIRKINFFLGFDKVQASRGGALVSNICSFRTLLELMTPNYTSLIGGVL